MRGDARCARAVPCRWQETLAERKLKMETTKYFGGERRQLTQDDVDLFLDRQQRVCKRDRELGLHRIAQAPSSEGGGPSSSGGPSSEGGSSSDGESTIIPPPRRNP